jgi:N-acetylglucosaminyldiphosphoundecaprenol N-acetyl-beta-D-mannosaminyltransferase
MGGDVRPTRILRPGDSQHAADPGSCELAGLAFDRCTEIQVVAHIVEAARQGLGGWVATPNVDICRAARRDPQLLDLLSGASLVVADGMPLVWASRLRGDPLPERVTGSSLIYSLTATAARHGQSVYLLGGEPGVADRAAKVLSQRHPGLVVTGTHSPPLGFEVSRDSVDAIRRRLAGARPDIVFVGLGFPKQERLIAELAPSFPATWFISCGAAIPFAAGTLRRAPRWMQRSGLEWAFRLGREPRRLAKRYLIDDLPFAAALLLSAMAVHPRRAGPQGGVTAGR